MFPGQGTQSAGMGAPLWDRFPEVAAAAEAALGLDVRALCCDDTDGRLHRTEFTQPALYVVNHLHHRACLQHGPPPAFLLGHSLGEFNALQAAGVFDFETGLRIVRRRGELMAAISGTGMAAIIGADRAEVERILADLPPELDIANVNAPTQVVIAGPLATLDLAGDRFGEEGYGFVPLKVGAAFHSRHMRAQTDAFRDFLAAFPFAPPVVPVVANVSARPYGSDPDTIRDTIVRQMESPVRWMDSVAFVRSQGVHRFVEAGSGNVLTNLLGKIP